MRKVREIKIKSSSDSADKIKCEFLKELKINEKPPDYIRKNLIETLNPNDNNYKAALNTIKGKLATLFRELFPGTLENFTDKEANLLFNIFPDLYDIPFEYFCKSGEPPLALKFITGRKFAQFVLAEGVIAKEYTHKKDFSRPKLLLLSVIEPETELNKNKYIFHNRADYIKEKLKRVFSVEHIKLDENNFCKDNILKELLTSDIFWFIGHGEYCADKKTGEILYKPNNKETTILTLQELCDVIKGNTKPQVIIFDACKTGWFAKDFIEAGVQYFIGAYGNVVLDLSKNFFESIADYLFIKQEPSGNALHKALTTAIDSNDDVFKVSYALFANPKFVFFNRAVNPLELDGPGIEDNKQNYEKNEYNKFKSDFNQKNIFSLYGSRNKNLLRQLILDNPLYKDKLIPYKAEKPPDDIDEHYYNYIFKLDMMSCLNKEFYKNSSSIATEYDDISVSFSIALNDFFKTDNILVIENLSYYSDFINDVIKQFEKRDTKAKLIILEKYDTIKSLSVLRIPCPGQPPKKSYDELSDQEKNCLKFLRHSFIQLDEKDENEAPSSCDEDFLKDQGFALTDVLTPLQTSGFIKIHNNKIYCHSKLNEIVKPSFAPDTHKKWAEYYEKNVDTEEKIQACNHWIEAGNISSAFKIVQNNWPDFLGNTPDKFDKILDKISQIVSKGIRKNDNINEINVKELSLYRIRTALKLMKYNKIIDIYNSIRNEISSKDKTELIPFVLLAYYYTYNYTEAYKLIENIKGQASEELTSEFYHYSGKIYGRMNKYEKAMEDLEKALKNQTDEKDRFPILLSKAQLMENYGRDLEDSLKLCEKVLNFENNFLNDSPYALEFKAMQARAKGIKSRIFFQRKNYGEALELKAKDKDMLISNDRVKAQLLIEMAACERFQKKYSDAGKHLEEANELYKKIKEVYITNYGLLHYHTEKARLLIDEIRASTSEYDDKSTKIKTNLEEAYFHIGELLKKTNSDIILSLNTAEVSTVFASFMILKKELNKKNDLNIEGMLKNLGSIRSRILLAFKNKKENEVKKLLEWCITELKGDEKDSNYPDQRTYELAMAYEELEKFYQVVESNSESAKRCSEEKNKLYDLLNNNSPKA